MSSPQLYIVAALFPSVKLIEVKIIMSKFAINIYSPVNLKKTFSIFFLLNYQHIIQRLGSFFVNHKMHITHRTMTPRTMTRGLK